jgi:hypothetical protein
LSGYTIVGPIDRLCNRDVVALGKRVDQQLPVALDFSFVLVVLGAELERISDEVRALLTHILFEALGWLFVEMDEDEYQLLTCGGPRPTMMSTTSTP